MLPISTNWVFWALFYYGSTSTFFLGLHPQSSQVSPTFTNYQLFQVTCHSQLVVVTRSHLHSFLWGRARQAKTAGIASRLVHLESWKSLRCENGHLYIILSDYLLMILTYIYILSIYSSTIIYYNLIIFNIYIYRRHSLAMILIYM